MIWQSRKYTLISIAGVSFKTSLKSAVVAAQVSDLLLST